MPSRFSFTSILLRLATASIAAAFVAGCTLAIGWSEFRPLFRPDFGFAPEPAPPTFLQFLASPDARAYHFMAANVAALVFAISFILSFKVHDRRSTRNFLLAMLSTIAFSILTAFMMAAIYLVPHFDHH